MVVQKSLMSNKNVLKLLIDNTIVNGTHLILPILAVVEHVDSINSQSISPAQFDNSDTLNQLMFHSTGHYIGIATLYQYD